MIRGAGGDPYSVMRPFHSSGPQAPWAMAWASAPWGLGPMGPGPGSHTLGALGDCQRSASHISYIEKQSYMKRSNNVKSNNKIQQQKKCGSCRMSETQNLPLCFLVFAEFSENSGFVGDSGKSGYMEKNIWGVRGQSGIPQNHYT